MSTTDDTTDAEDTTCPTCGRDDFASSRGKKLHHAKTHDESIAGVETECAQCGEAFRAKPSRSNGRRFCDKVCLAAWQSENLSEDNSVHWKGSVERECQNCGEVFEARDTDYNNQIYCSRQCAGEGNAPDRNRVTSTCHECGNEYDVVPARAEKTRYCSLDCKNKQVQLTCDQCSDEFHVPRSQQHRRFCSKTCSINWQSENKTGPNHPHWKGGKVNVQCEVCGAAVQVDPHEEDSRRFCSNDCSGQWMSNEFSGEDSWNWTGGGSLNYGSNWLRQRERALRRDQYRCQECGITAPTYRAEAGRGLDVHHRTPLREFRAGDTIDHEAGNDLSNLVALCRPCHRRAERNL